MRLVMPWEKGVSTTQGMSGNFCLISLATSKASLSAVPGMQITKSTCMEPNVSAACSMVEAWVKVGG